MNATSGDPRLTVPGAEEIPAASRSLATRMLRVIKGRREIFTVYAIALVLLAIDVYLQPEVLSIRQLNVQTAATLTLIIVAAGQTLVILSGGIDLSVGGIVTLSSCFAATRLSGEHGSMAIWLVLIPLIGLGAGILNGLLIAYRGMQSFVVTLATWSIWNGVALIVLPQEGGTVPPSFTRAMNTKVGEIGIPVLAVLFLALLWVWFRSAPWGSRIAAVGSNPRSAFLSGIPVRFTLLLAYALSGMLAAIAGLFLVSQTSGASPLVGGEYVLSSVAAVVVGGVALSGGRGSFVGVIAGAYVLTLISSVVFGLGLESYWQPLLTGILLVSAVAASTFVNRNSEG